MDGGAPDDAEAALGPVADPLAQACQDLDELEQTLHAALEDARRPTADMRGLSAWAERRLALQEQAARLERRAMAALARAGLGRSGSLAQLDDAAPGAAAAVRARVDSVRARWGQLREADHRRALLVARCREIVGRYLGALDPPVRAYGPRGARPPSGEGAPTTIRSSVRRSA